MCGRLATPALSQATCTRAMLRSTRSMSMTAQGVPYSRAILAARGVVISQLHFIIPVIASEAKQSIAPQSKYGLLRRFAPLRKRFAFVAGNDGIQAGTYSPRYAFRTSGLVLISAAGPCIRTRPVCRM